MTKPDMTDRMDSQSKIVNASYLCQKAKHNLTAVRSGGHLEKAVCWSGHMSKPGLTTSSNTQLGQGKQA